MFTVTTAASPPPPQYSYQPCHNGSRPQNNIFSTAWSLHPCEKKIQTGRPAPQKTHWHDLCSPATSPNDRGCRGGRRKKMWLKQISSIKESAQEEICLHQSAKDCQNLPSIYLQNWEESREVWPPRLPSVSAEQVEELCLTVLCRA